MSTKRKLPSKLGQPQVKQSAKIMGKGNLDESTTVVSSGGKATNSRLQGETEVVDISSDSSSAEGEEEDSNEDAEEQDGAHSAEGDVVMEDA